MRDAIRSILLVLVASAGACSLPTGPGSNDDSRSSDCYFYDGALYCDGASPSYTLSPPPRNIGA
jgi:hypothetical protein